MEGVWRARPRGRRGARDEAEEARRSPVFQDRAVSAVTRGVIDAVRDVGCSCTVSPVCGAWKELKERDGESSEMDRRED